MSASEAPASCLTHGGPRHGLGHRGPESQSIVVPYASGCSPVRHGAVFGPGCDLCDARHATDGGPTSGQLFDRAWWRSRRSRAAVELQPRLAMIAAKRGNMAWTQGWLLVTGCSASSPVDRDLRIHRTGAEGAPRSAALSVGLFTSSAVTERTLPRPAVDRHDDGADLGQGFQETSSADCCA